MANPPDTDDTIWTQRGFLIAAAAVGLIAVLAIVLALTTGGDSAVPKPAPTPVSPQQTSTPEASSNGSVCGLPAGADEVPTGGLPRTRWDLVGSMAAPTATATFGPGRRTDGFRMCFARSPTGALYAAASFWATATAKPNADVLQRLAADTPVRPAAIADARRQGAAAKLDANGRLQIAGYNFTSSDQNAASIDLAFRLQNGKLLRVPTAMRWEQGDWKYVIPPGGNPGGGELPDLTGYVPWSGA